MTACYCLMPMAAVMLITGCASTPPPKTAQATPAPVWTETTGTGTTTEHKAVQSYNNQILNSERAMDSDSPAISNAQNQGIP